MTRRQRGEATIHRLLAARGPQIISGAMTDGQAWMNKATRMVDTAKAIVDDPESALVLTYDAGRQVATRSLGQQSGSSSCSPHRRSASWSGDRPETRGSRSASKRSRESGFSGITGIGAGHGVRWGSHSIEGELLGTGQTGPDLIEYQHHQRTERRRLWDEMTANAAGYDQKDQANSFTVTR